jgi:hypothetical protein
MWTAKRIIEELERLPSKERRLVLRHLEQSLTYPAPQVKRAKPRRLRRAPYAALLELAGTAHGNHKDVSTDKYRHLAAAYGDTHEPT